MKIFDLIEESGKLKTEGKIENFTHLMALLNIRSMEHYIRESNKIIRYLYKHYDDPLSMKIQLDLALKKNTEELVRRGLKEEESNVKIDLTI